MCNGGLVLGASGDDSIPVPLMPGEHVYGPDGKLIFAVGGAVTPPDPDGEPPGKG